MSLIVRSLRTANTFFPTMARPLALRLRLPSSNLQVHHRTFSTPKKIYVMPKTEKIGIVLLVGLSLLTTTAFAADSFSDKVSHFLSKSEEFAPLRKDIEPVWRRLLADGAIEVSGTDKEIRPPFVALQGIIEHALSCELGQSITSLKGIIHTPMPATPLCTAGEISKDLVDLSIAKDPQRLFTVKAKTTIIRDFLSQGAQLVVAYPKGGLEKRTVEQQTIYKQECEKFSKNLIDQPLNCSEIPEDLIGATYIFKDKAGHEYAFGIKMTQAKDPKEKGHFGLWFGSLQNEKVSQRVNAVMSFLNKANPH